MIEFFRKHSTKVVWVIIIIFLVTTISGIVLQGLFSGNAPSKSMSHKPSEGVIAVAGDIQVDRSIYDQYLNENVYSFQISRPFQVPSPEVLEWLQMDAFSKSVQYLVMQKGASDSKVKVTKAELKQHMTAILPQMGFKSESEFKKKLKERQMKYKDFVNSQKQDLEVQKFMGLLQSKVTVSDVDVDRKYTDVDVQHILFRITPERKLPQAATFSSEVRSKIAQGLDFNEAVRLYSDDESSKQSGGRLGWLGQDVIPAMYDVMHSLKIGEVSQPFLTRFGYHIIKVAGKRDRLRPLDLNYDREKQTILSQKRQQVSEAYLQTQLAGKTFEFSDPFLEGHHRKREGKLEAVRGAYQRAVSLMPNSALPHSFIAQIYLSEGQGALAKDELLKASVKGELNASYDLASVHMMLAYIHSLEKDPSNVKLSLDKALSLSENDYLALQQLKPLIQKMGSDAQKAKFNQLAIALEAKISEAVKAQQAKQVQQPQQK